MIIHSFLRYNFVFNAFSVSSKYFKSSGLCTTESPSWKYLESVSLSSHISISHVSRDFLLQIKIDNEVQFSIKTEMRHCIYVYFIAHETNLTNISLLSEKAADAAMRVSTHFLKERKATAAVLNCLLPP